MRSIAASFVPLAIWFLTVISVSADEPKQRDDLETLVAKAIEGDQRLFEGLNQKFEKNKLTKDESDRLFEWSEKKKPTKAEKRAMMETIRKGILSGRETFRRLSLEGMEIGSHGRLSSNALCFGDPIQLRLYATAHVRQIISKNEFLGVIEFANSNTGKKSVDPKLILFRNFPGIDKLADEGRLPVNEPLLVTGRFSYESVGAGAKTVLVLEPLSYCVEKVNDAGKK